MSLLAPLFLFLALLALPILLLYMLKLRRREVQISSVMLWQALLRDRQANTPWQRLRRNLLLILQLLILAALVLALARPALPAPGVSAGAVIVLLDASASMAATDVAPSRFEVARAAARDLIDTLGSNNRMTLILVGQQPSVLASAESDPTSLRRALDAAAVTQGAANWESALALAAGAAASMASGSETPQDSVTVILSDGGLPTEGLPPLPGEVRYVPIGLNGENLAVSALALRSTGSGAELFTSLTNYGRSDRAAILSIYINGELFTAQQITIPAGQSLPISLSGLPGASAIYQARLSYPAQSSQPADPLALDDVAFAIYQPPRTGRALLISPGNFFLEQVLTAMPGLEPYRAVAGEDGAYTLSGDPFELYVLDGMLPTGEQLPPGSLLLVNPPSNPLFSVGAVVDVTGGGEVLAHPLTEFLDWSNVHIARARQVALPSWGETLVQGPSGPLVFVGETANRRVAVLTFDLHDSDLPLQVDFPILFAGLIHYLLPAQAFDAPNGLQPGESLSILPGPQISQVVVALPSGRTYALPPAESGILFSETGELGVYAVNYLGSDPTYAEFFAVNLFSQAESNIQPAGNIQVGQTSIAPSAEEQLSLRDLWPWLAGAALAILMLEWWVYHRRSLPQKSQTARSSSLGA